MRDTGRRWGRASSVTPRQQRLWPLGASRLTHPLPPRRCNSSCFPLFSCNISPSQPCALPFAPALRLMNIQAGSPGSGWLVLEEPHTRSWCPGDRRGDAAGWGKVMRGGKREQSWCLAKQTRLCDCLAAREQKSLHFSVGNRGMDPCRVLPRQLCERGGGFGVRPHRWQRHQAPNPARSLCPCCLCARGDGDLEGWHGEVLPALTSKKPRWRQGELG